MAGALHGWRVLEVADGVAAGFCTKVLADLGAEVIMVEPPEGHPGRRQGPRRPGGPSARFAYLSAGKASAVIDHGADGDATLKALVGDSDVVVTDGDPTALRRLGSLPDGVVHVSIRPFGASGAAAAYNAVHLTVFHAGGEGALLPSGPGFSAFPDRPPIQVGSELGYYDAGWNAAVAVLAGCFGRLRNPGGERVDVSVQESELTLNRFRLSRFMHEGTVMHREASRYGITGTLRCADGWVQLVHVRDDQWDKLIASEEAGPLADPQFESADGRREHQDQLGVALAAWCLARSKHDVVRTFASLGAPVGIYATPDDLFDSQQLAERAFFHRVAWDSGELLLPGSPYRLSATPARVGPPPSPPPSLQAPSDPTTPAPPNARWAVARSQRPGDLHLPAGRLLDGVRVLDFTWAAAGPYASMLLALLGADVVKVESSKRLDSMRAFGGRTGSVNGSYLFNELNLNKRGIQVDLSRPEGRDLVGRLVGWADVVLDNFRPGVMARLGLGADELLAAHPHLVVGSSSANGSSGPEATAAGLASIFGASGGLGEQTGYPDGPPTEVGETTDFRSGNAFAVGILAALVHLAQTGQGQHVDLASREVVVASTPDALLAHQLGVDWAIRAGNAHPEFVPHGVYPCAGEDRWVAVAVTDERGWAALATVIGNPDWLGPQWSTPAARRSREGEIDGALAAWSAQQQAEEAAHLLQEVGVVAAAVMTTEMLANDRHLQSRGVWAEVAHPELGTAHVLGAPWHFSGGLPAVRPGPLLGQHTAEVLEEVLGIGPAEMASLADVLV